MPDTMHDSHADAIGAAVFAVAATQGWSRVSPAEVALEAGLPARDVIRTHPGHEALVDEAFRMIDRKALAGRTEVDPAEPVRDRLFDVLIARFEVMQPYREAVARFLRNMPLHPMDALVSAFRLGRSMALSLEAAGVSVAGPFGYLRIKGLAYTYLWVLRTFVQDDTPDLARTMAALDKALKNVDSLVAMVPGLGGRRTAAAPDADDMDPPPAPAAGTSADTEPDGGATPGGPVRKAPGTSAPAARTTPTGDEPEIEPGDD